MTYVGMAPAATLGYAFVPRNVYLGSDCLEAVMGSSGMTTIHGIESPQETVAAPRRMSGIVGRTVDSVYSLFFRVHKRVHIKLFRLNEEMDRIVDSHDLERQKISLALIKEHGSHSFYSDALVTLILNCRSADTRAQAARALVANLDYRRCNRVYFETSDREVKEIVGRFLDTMGS